MRKQKGYRKKKKLLIFTFQYGRIKKYCLKKWGCMLLTRVGKPRVELKAEMSESGMWTRDVRKFMFHHKLYFCFFRSSSNFGEVYYIKLNYIGPLGNNFKN